MTDEEYDYIVKYGPKGKRSGQGRMPIDPYAPHEIVRYTFDDGTDSLRRYYRDTMRIREDYRQWVGSGEIWPEDFVDWWMHFMKMQTRSVEAQNPGKRVVDYDLVTGEFLINEEAAGHGVDSGD